jgi:hypothetical protein
VGQLRVSEGRRHCRAQATTRRQAARAAGRYLPAPLSTRVRWPCGLARPAPPHAQLAEAAMRWCTRSV